jgi:hypothetical protein
LIANHVDKWKKNAGQVGSVSLSRWIYMWFVSHVRGRACYQRED